MERLLTETAFSTPSVTPSLFLCSSGHSQDILMLDPLELLQGHFNLALEQEEEEIYDAQSLDACLGTASKFLSSDCENNFAIDFICKSKGPTPWTTTISLQLHIRGYQTSLSLV